MTIDLSDGASYVAAVPHDVFASLRSTSPVYWQEMDGQPGYWAVLRHADVIKVATHPTLFSASEGGVVLEDLPEQSLMMMRRMLLAMDPPIHFEHRRPLVQSFKPKAIGEMEGRIRAICRSIMDDVRARAAEIGSDVVEFVHDVTAKLPSQVIGELMGLPREDWAHIHRLAELNTSSQDPDTVGDDSEYATAGNASMEMAIYAIGFAARRRAEERRDDLTDLILNTDFGGAPMTDIDFGSFFVQLVTAGNDTTKTMLASGLLALLEHPEQLAELRADASLIPGAVEEILRWAPPLHYFRRTATEDTDMLGTPIKAGEKVAMYYVAANRDPAVFVDPDRFDIHRSPNPHLSFGFGEHHCLGIHLARLEGKVFFEELLAAFPTIELAGQPQRLRSNLNNGLRSLPIRLGS